MCVLVGAFIHRCEYARILYLAPCVRGDAHHAHEKHNSFTLTCRRGWNGEMGDRARDPFTFYARDIITLSPPRVSHPLLLSGQRYLLNCFMRWSRAPLYEKILSYQREQIVTIKIASVHALPEYVCNNVSYRVNLHVFWITLNLSTSAYTCLLEISVKFL